MPCRRSDRGHAPAQTRTPVLRPLVTVLAYPSFGPRPRSHGRQLRLSLPPRHHTHAHTGCGASAHRCTSTGSPPTATQGHGPARGRLAGTSRHHHRHRSPATAATHPADTPRPALASLGPSTVRHAPAPTSSRRTNTPFHPKADAFEEHGAPTTQRTCTAR